MSVSDAVRSGGRRGILEAQLEALAADIDVASPEVKPALSREIRLVLKELEGLPDGVSSDSRGDALAARRKAKKTANG